MSNKISNQDLIIKLKNLQQEVIERLENLLNSSSVGIQFDDINERIEECMKALDNLQRSINRLS